MFLRSSELDPFLRASALYTALGGPRRLSGRLSVRLKGELRKV